MTYFRRASPIKDVIPLPDNRYRVTWEDGTAKTIAPVEAMPFLRAWLAGKPIEPPED